MWMQIKIIKQLYEYDNINIYKILIIVINALI